jgi:hypothetical protein
MFNYAAAFNQELCWNVHSDVDLNSVVVGTDGASVLIYGVECGVPTGQPIEQPTGEPTGLPTAEPTGQPTGQPTGPTGQPSTQPSGEPTGRPSTQPTGEPTAMPTVVPTCKPSTSPTGQPSGQPTAQPTGQPTGHPTVSVAEETLSPFAIALVALLGVGLFAFAGSNFGIFTSVTNGLGSFLNSGVDSGEKVTELV